MRKQMYLTVSRLGSVALFVGLFGLFSIRMPTQWLTTSNLLDLVEQTVILGVAALGMTMVRAVGEIDLSVGAMVGLTSILSARVLVANGPVVLALLVALGCGAVVGLGNGFMRGVLQLPGVIPTVGSQSIVLGLAYVFSGGAWFVWGSSPSLTALRNAVGRGYFWHIPRHAVVLVAVAAAVIFLLNRTRLGRVFYMVGGNSEASRLSGVSVRSEIVMAYALCGLCAATGGVLMTARLGAGNVGGGADYVLDSLIAVNVGSTILAEEQEPSAVGSLVGAFFVTTVQKGLQMMGQGNDAMCILRGVLLLAAIALFSLRKRALE